MTGHIKLLIVWVLLYITGYVKLLKVSQYFIQKSGQNNVF